MVGVGRKSSRSEVLVEMVGVLEADGVLCYEFEVVGGDLVQG